ncbi:tryptophan-rich sensory protein [Streptomyces clavifer]|nr:MULTISPECIES: tryptophan-rich sensory protein [unclassified Streptomyces]WRY86574.1 tryptophan-rich sensory protein [Streptomyces clavifer]WRY86948.1 tryptophan-rich sensory protein [Streptomyces clavifer]WRY87023.1 tryptophan-rich sensory protein [Streptomyces clavifer]WUC25878.1 tryptophan-rich sensory protein [Streptomyces clavifer]WUC31934.1 tryptophan-rich sensory protein [Streptomyces clavifer]
MDHLLFRRRSPRAGQAGTVLSDVSHADLIRRSAASDRTAAVAPAPCVDWCLFATAWNVSLVRRDPRRMTWSRIRCR